MKNARIVRALDSINPTDAQKKRMRAALEAKLKGEEENNFPNLTTMDFSVPENRPVKQTEGNRKPDKHKYSSAKPAKSRGMAPALIAAMLALVITGGLFLGVMKGKLEETPSCARPTENQTTMPTTSVTEALETMGLPQAYQDIIARYVTAVEEEWNPAQCSEGGISVLTAEVDSMDAVGYTLMDVDGDSTQELLMTDGDMIFDLFSLSPDGEAIQWVTSMNRIQYRLCQDGLISCVGSSSAALSYYTFYRYGNGTLDKIVEVTYDGERDKNNPWFLGDNMQPLTSLEADKILNEHPYVYLPYTTLSGQAPLPEEVPDEQVLERYAQALSPLIEGDTGYGLQLYCFYDYDGDGKTELLLGRRQSVSMILEETNQGGVDMAPFYPASSGEVYPCENSVMEFVGYGQGCFHHTYIEYSGQSEGKRVAYLFTDEEKWYTQNENTETITISEAAAKTVLDNYKRVNLPWKNLEAFPVSIPNADGISLSPLFVNVFLPFANGGKAITGEELIHEVENNGMTAETGEGMYYVKDISRAGAHLSASMITVDSMIYVIEGDLGRFVRATMEEDGMRYYLGAYLHEYPAESVEQLQQLIQADNDTIALWRAAESYAMDYFQDLGQKEREDLSREQGREVYVLDHAYTIQDITGLNIWKQRYQETGSVEIDIAAYVDSPDSFTYLTMQCEQVGGVWQVTDAWLEK